MQKASLSDRLRYWFDNTLSRGPIAIISWLAIFTIVMVLISTVFVWVTSADKEASILEQIWAFSMLALEPDALTFGHWPLRVATIIIVLTSIFVLSTLIGVLTTGIESKLEDMRKGRSRVIESDHTVLLGWSAHIFPIISELVIANQNQKKSCIVILGDKDKIEMEDAIQEKVGFTGQTRIVCRHGDPMEIDDLQIASLNTSRSIIILPPAMNGEADTSIIKTLLAIIKNPNRRSQPYHVVTALRDPKNLAVAKIVGQDEVELVSIPALIARIVAQTCRQRGLSDVYQELLDFKGDEVYFHNEPSLTGATYQDALLAYPDTTVIGLHSQGAGVTLNPAKDFIIQEKDNIIAITADDDTFHISQTRDYEIDANLFQHGETFSPQKEHTLILGWNQLGFQILGELDHYVPEGSSLTVVSDFSLTDKDASKFNSQDLRQSCTFQQGDTSDRQTLESLPLDNFENIILLAYSDKLSAKQADARTLMTLLHLRDIADKQGYRFSLISEVLDVRNRELAKAARVDDFIVSDRLISLILSQISEHKFLGAVFEDLLNPEGSEIYLKPASLYIQLEKPTNFYTVISAASRRGETALGYRKSSGPNRIFINPTKSDPVSFGEVDRIIVLAEQ
jgi:ion channel POLLUX/CASTOR